MKLNRFEDYLTNESNIRNINDDSVKYEELGRIVKRILLDIDNVIFSVLDENSVNFNGKSFSMDTLNLNKKSIEKLNIPIAKVIFDSVSIKINFGIEKNKLIIILDYNWVYEEGGNNGYKIRKEIKTNEVNKFLSNE